MTRARKAQDHHPGLENPPWGGAVGLVSRTGLEPVTLCLEAPVSGGLKGSTLRLWEPGRY
jgi:hypothetical protein